MIKNKNPILVTSLIILTIGLIYFFISDTSTGKTYASKQNLCIQFAQSYLKTIPKTEPNFTDETWRMAVDVETDLYNMCLLKLTKEALMNYQSSITEKYKVH